MIEQPADKPTIKLEGKTKNFTGIILIILCAIVAFASTSYLLKTHTIQYSSLPKAVSVKVNDPNSPGRAKILKLQVYSNLPVDTAQRSIYGGKYIGDDLLFHQNPTFLMWTMLICIMISIAAGSFPAFIGQIRQLKEDFKLRPVDIRFGLFCAIVLTSFLAFTNMRLPGYYAPPAIMRDLHILFETPNAALWIVGITMVLMIPALTVIFLVAKCSDRILAGPQKKDNDPNQTLDITDIEQATAKLKIIHKSLQNVLYVLAVIVVFTVLTSTALGQSIKATVGIRGFDLFPKEASLVYGLYFSLFLCIIYIPVYYYIKLNYNRLKEKANELNPSDDIKEKPWYKDLFSDTRFEGTALDNLKLAFTLLAPLLTSFLPESLHLFK
jgi:hypothetical protein